MAHARTWFAGVLSSMFNENLVLVRITLSLKATWPSPQAVLCPSCPTPSPEVPQDCHLHLHFPVAFLFHLFGFFQFICPSIFHLLIICRPSVRPSIHPLSSVSPSISLLTTHSPSVVPALVPRLVPASLTLTVWCSFGTRSCLIAQV